MLGFLDLPGEIRNQIYCEIFPPTTRFVMFQSGAGVKSAQFSMYTFGSLAGGAQGRRGLLLAKHLGILGMNGAIRHEAIGLLLHNVHGELQMSSKPNFKAVPRIILAAIRRMLRRGGREIAKESLTISCIVPTWKLWPREFMCIRISFVEDWTG